MIMWLFALAAAGIAIGLFFGYGALKNVKTKPAWEKADERNSVRACTAAPSDGTKQVAAEGVNGPESHADGGSVAETKKASGKELWVDSNYCWVVVCKNHWFHRHPNIFNVHRIPLGQTDAVLTRPPIDALFSVRCDECGKEYIYKPSEVLRYEMEVPLSFVPHPLFRD
jgi:hypothetical protein